MATLRLQRAEASSPRRYLLTSALALLGLLAGCAPAESPAAPADDAELVEGRDIYIRNCANCHGGAGGGGVGSKLDEGRAVERYPDAATQIELVANGVRAMPRFDEKLSAAEIEAVVRYTREIISASG